MIGWKHLTEDDRRSLLTGIARGKALGGPFHVELDVVEHCNVDCVFCSVRRAGQMGGEILAWSRLEQVLDELISGGLRSVRLAGGGEPLLHPHLPQVLEKLTAARIPLENLTTNGIALSRNNIARLSRMQVDDVYVSLNYATPEHYARFMQTDSRVFQTVIDNLKAYDEALRAAGRRERTIVTIQFVVHRTTIDDFPRMIDLALKLPVDHVAVQPVGLLPQEEYIQGSDAARLLALIQEHVPRLPAHFWIDIEAAPFGIGAEVHELLAQLPAGWTPPPGTQEHRIEYCYIGWYSMAVRGNGDVHPCCFLMTDTTIPPLGNVQRQSVGEIWHGAPYRRLRGELREAMMFEGHTPLQHRRARQTRPACWEHGMCPLAYNLADPGFYAEAHAALEAERRRPLWRVARTANAGARAAVNFLRRR
jgi:MoaA/NifB/PqqE/SkfB family radical SAM enzyme